MKTIDDVVRTFDYAVRLKKKGMSVNAVLRKLNKQYTSLKRVENIHILYVTRSNMFELVSSTTEKPINYAI